MWSHRKLRSKSELGKKRQTTAKNACNCCAGANILSMMIDKPKHLGSASAGLPLERAPSTRKTELLQLAALPQTMASRAE
jgi:hypothetical protein